MKEHEESSRQKTWRYFFMTALGAGLIFCAMKIPSTSAISDLDGQIQQTNKEIAQQTKVIQANSPANVSKNFDLIKAEKKAQQRLFDGISFALGGAKNRAEYDKARAQLNAYIGKDMTDTLYKFNGNSEDAINNPKDFKFDLIGDKTLAQVTFKPVTDVNNAQINVVATYYAREDGKTKKYRSLLIFDYDLANQKVIDSKVVNFSDPNLSGNNQ